MIVGKDALIHHFIISKFSTSSSQTKTFFKATVLANWKKALSSSIRFDVNKLQHFIAHLLPVPNQYRDRWFVVVVFHSCSFRRFHDAQKNWFFCVRSSTTKQQYHTHFIVIIIGSKSDTIFITPQIADVLLCTVYYTWFVITSNFINTYNCLMMMMNSEAYKSSVIRFIHYTLWSMWAILFILHESIIITSTGQLLTWVLLGWW